MNPEETRKIWTEQLPPGQFRHLFDHLPGTLFFAKDREGRLMAGNPARDDMFQMRVIEACDLLVRTNQEVTTVALEVGF